jgi:hypothetical protein
MVRKDGQCSICFETKICSPFYVKTTPNCYNVGKFTDYLVAPDQVMLTTPDPLALHATCAQVAPLSGAREYLDQILEETEEMEVLAQDGTSSKVLHHVLITLNSRAITIDV